MASWTTKWKLPKTVDYKTKAPTGLSIKRNGMKFTFAWKCKDKNYGAGQWLEWAVRRVGSKTWDASRLVNISASTRKKVLTLDASDYYPTTSVKIAAIRFGVCGCRSDFTTTEIVKKDTAKKINWKQEIRHWTDVSKWVYKTFKLVAPKPPKAPTFARGNAYNGTFSWTAPTKATDHRPFTRVQYQSTLKKNFTGKLAKAGGWSAISNGSASGSKAYTEDSSLIANQSYTRIFRVRSCGPRGASKWMYKSHVYAMPNTPKIDTSIIQKTGLKRTRSNRQGSVIHTVVKWSVAKPANRPIDSMTAEYLVDTPESGLACPAGGSWTEALTVKWKDKTIGAEFNSDTDVGEDQCMWVRVTAKHDDNIAYSKPVRTMAGQLKDPTFVNPPTTTGTTISVEIANESEVPGSRVAVWLRRASTKDKQICIGIISAGQTTATINCPNLSNETSYQVGLQTFTGTAAGSNVSEQSYKIYTLTTTMTSKLVWNDTSTLAQPPDKLTATATASDSVKLSWDWTWADAEAVQIAWADHEDAWESTEEPSTYDIDHKATHWSVGGLDAGATWYFRARFIDTSGEDDIYSPWSDIVSLNLASAPTSPTLAASDAVLNMSDTIYMTCGSTGTGDFTVSIAEVIVTEGYVANPPVRPAESPLLISYTEFEVTEEVEGQEVTRTKYKKEEVLAASGMPVIILQEPVTAQLAISISDINELYTARSLTQYKWTENTMHYLAARVTNAEGVASETWSNLVAVQIVAEPVITSVTTSLVTETVTEDEDEGTPVTRTVNALKALPLTVAVIGAGEGGITRVAITRADDYRIARPTEFKEDRYAGEIIAVVQQTGEALISIGKDDLIGALDDEAKYILSATVVDNYGQSVTEEIEFEARWTHQPEIPAATVEVDDDNMIVKITPTVPDGYTAETGDVCDIYRLSIDRPVLIVRDAIYGITYVDPYPAFNEHGGHLVVAKTANEDYITSDGRLSWLYLQGEAEDIINEDTVIIDFDGQRISLPYNISLGNSWEKDFERTTYLGGSVEGDWNPAVTRDLDLSTDVVLTVPAGSQTQSDMRRLADFPGICHVRTPEGSSFAANINVTENIDGSKANLISYSLDVKKVDPEGEEGMTLAQWNSMHGGN